MSDDEKWANIVKNDDDTEEEENGANVNNAHSICLKQIPPEEMDSHRPVKRVKRQKKSNYFVTDSRLELTGEDMKYQLSNCEDTLNMNQISATLRKKNARTIEKFDKLVKLPERALSSTLELYFAKNLKPIESSCNCFDISYEDIQNDVDRSIAIRNHRKDPTNHAPPPKIKPELTDLKSELEDSCLTSLNCDFSAPPRKSRKSSTQSTVLEDIDNDFKPTINLTTKTYTRKKVKENSSNLE